MKGMSVVHACGYAKICVLSARAVASPDDGGVSLVGVPPRACWLSLGLPAPSHAGADTLGPAGPTVHVIAWIMLCAELPEQQYGEWSGQRAEGMSHYRQNFVI